MASRSKAKFVKGPAIPNIPWEERPKGCTTVLWRSERNPIITRNHAKDTDSLYNSAVVPYKGEFAGVFRCDDTARNMNIRGGTSKDGVHWKIDPKPIKFIGTDSKRPEITESDYKYDPRVTWIEDRYYVTWCNGYHGPTIGVGYTHDFKKFYQIENAFLPCNRNGVLFPKKIGGRYAMLSRPSDNAHTRFGDIFYSESPDMCFWGRHRHVMGPTWAAGWQSTKIGPGPAPIETREGWLLIYHGVLNSCNGFVYAAGAALSDIDKPWKVIRRTKPYILSPRTLYECVGGVNNVVFPCAALCDSATGRMAIYYGAADTVVALAFAQIEDLVDFVKKNSL